MLSPFLVFYQCTHHDLPVVRAVEASDTIHAIIAAREEERDLTGVNCLDCVLATVRLAR